MSHVKQIFFLCITVLLAGCAQLRPAVQPETPAQEEMSQPEKTPDFLPWGRIGARIASGHAGVRVTDIIPDSPAEQAGILPNDTILSINKQRCTDVDETIRHIRSIKPDTTIEIIVYRAGNHMPFSVSVTSFDRDEQLVMMMESAIRAQDYARAIDLLSIIESPEDRGSVNLHEKEIVRLKNLLPEQYQPE